MARSQFVFGLSATVLFLAVVRGPETFSPAPRLLGFLRRTVLQKRLPRWPSPRRLPRSATPEQDLSLVNGALLEKELLSAPRSSNGTASQAAAPAAPGAPAVAPAPLPKAAVAPAVAPVPAPAPKAAASAPAVAKAKEAFREEMASGRARAAAAPAEADAALEPLEDVDAADVNGGILNSGKSLFSSLANGLKAATTAPSWAPLAVVAAAVLALSVFVSSSLQAPEPKPVRPAPAPVVVPVEKPELLAPTTRPSPAPVPAPTPPPPAPVQASAQPSRLIPAAKPSPAPAPAGGLSWARRLTQLLASGLRTAADKLPDAELELERQLPTVERGVRWALEVRPENAEQKAKEALPVLGTAVAKGTEVVVRSGLHLGSTGLGLASEYLPEVGNTLQSATVQVLPTLQAGVHVSADATRAAADGIEALAQGPLPRKVPEQVRQALAKAPPALDNAAVVLDAAADAAPSAEGFVNYAAGKAMPIARAVLAAFSEVAADAAKAPLPEPVQPPEASRVHDALLYFGVDSDELTAAARAQATGAAAELSAKLPDPAKLASDAVRDVLGEPVMPPTKGR